ncbi:hypothetical protein Cocul_00236 [Corynebacterium oculi]|uniref:HTH tetR-type domain-containing protein n=2 Tax=Corynebacterium oculi TaxID=1544416 RepID=A0A0Q0YRT7_9CORY|nr:hypothetical protein Cocul_00236 [Corynebacterium oculi]
MQEEERESPATRRRRLAFQRRQKDFLRIALAKFKESGIESFTLTGLAAESDYSKGTWYNHFGSISDVIVAIATENAMQQQQYFREIFSEENRPLDWKVTSIFLDYVSHAITNPEMWTCGVLSRTWARGEGDVSLEGIASLDAAEGANQEIVLRMLREGDRLAVRGEGADEALRRAKFALHTVRAAAAGLCVLNVVDNNYAWAQETAYEQTITLILSTLETVRLPVDRVTPPEKLWESSRGRVRRLSYEWIIP